VQRELTEALSKHEQASRDLARAEEARAQLQGIRSFTKRLDSSGFCHTMNIF
jgi:hypothetical protein